ITGTASRGSRPSPSDDGRRATTCCRGLVLAGLGVALFAPLALVLGLELVGPRRQHVVELAQAVVEAAGMNPRRQLGPEQPDAQEAHGDDEGAVGRNLQDAVHT